MTNYVHDEELPERPANGIVTLRFPDPRTARVRAYGDGVDVSRYLSDAYSAVQRETGMSPMCVVSAFSDETGSGTEIRVIPSDEPAGARIIG